MIKYANTLPPRRGFELIDEHTVRKTSNLGSKGELEVIEAIVNFFEANPDPYVVRVSNFKFLPKNNNMFQYSYDMERLTPISLEEKWFINQFADFAWYRQDPFDIQNWCQFFTDEQPSSYFKTLLEGGHPLVEFLRTIIDQDRYNDLHHGNVMMNLDGDYVLLDLEGFMKGLADLSSYHWLPQPDNINNNLVALNNMAAIQALAPIL